MEKVLLQSLKKLKINYQIINPKTVCSFLNRNGGNIFLGIDDDGNVLGVDKDFISQMKKDFVNLCNNEQKINPTVYLNIKDYLVDDKYILQVYVK